jgi:PAS domain S-box-containing protein
MPLDFRAVLEVLADAAIVSDASGRITFLNAAAHTLLGWSKDQLIGRPLTTIMPERMRAAHEQGFARFIATREPRILGKPIRVPALHHDGREIDIELTLSIVDQDGQLTIIGVLRDLRERIELEQKLFSQRLIAAQYAVATVLADAVGTAEAIPRVLRALTEALDWEVGVYWNANPDGSLDAKFGHWRGDPRNEAFARTSQRIHLQRGEGWPGRVHESGQAMFGTELDRAEGYVRRELAVALGLKSVLLFPVICSSHRHGVLEFLSAHAEERDEQLVRLMTGVGFTIGQFMERLEIETSLRESREWLQTLLKSIGDAVIATDQHGAIRFMNPIAEQITGWTAAEAIARPLDQVLRIIDEETHATMESPVETVIRERRIVHLANHTMLVPTRAPQRVIEDSGAPILDRSGKLIGVVMCFRDVSEKKRIERREREAERRAAMIADLVPELVWTLSAEGGLEFRNQRWQDYAGKIEGDWLKLVHPADRARVSAAWKRTREISIPLTEEARLCRATDGEILWHLLRIVPIKDAEDRRVGWAASATEIERQKREEEGSRFLDEATALLSASLDYEKTLRALATLSVPRIADWCSITLADQKRPLIIAHVDPEKVRWAQELSEKYPPEQTAKTGAHHVIRTGKSELYSEIPDSLLSAAAKNAEHLELMRKVGLRSGMIVPMNAGGRTIGAITFISAESRRTYRLTDVALAEQLAERAAHAVDNARLYAEAQHAVRVRDEFLAIASHELRTPLTPLQLQVQALQKSPNERSSARLETISRQVARLEELVNNLVDISHITAHSLRLEYSTVDLAEVLREVVAKFQMQAARSSSTIKVTSIASATGWFDRARVQQIIANLLSNAIKFGSGGAIDVTLTVEQDIARLSVRDDGIGIADEARARIFERFERAVSSQHYGGFGLGLWLTRELVEAQGGAIHVESELGKGSSFTVALPLKRAELPAPSSLLEVKR